MVASLCGLRELIRRDPGPYRNLVHYFTNILKQAAEGKLGRAYEYHRAPAPFVQLELLRLLAAMGAGDKGASENMYAVIAEVKRRAEPLGNNIGNALLYECVKAAAAIHPSPVLIAGAMESVTRFLASRENNLRYAGIDALTRLVHIDPKHAQDHQLAVVDCLRSPDVTLKRKTLQLLYKMAGPTNIEVIAGEVLHYLREAAPGDEVARADAVRSLCDLAERFAPDHAWFVETMNELFEVAGEVVPPSLADNLTRLIAEGTGEEDENADRELRAGAVEAYLDLLDKPKLPRVLLKVICWVLGEYGRLAGRSEEGVMDALAAIPETQAGDDEVKGWVVSALGKLAAQAGRPLTPDAAALVEAATCAESVELQQRALEVQALLRTPAATQRAALPYDAAAEDIGVDPDLPFLESFVLQSLQNGAPPSTHSARASGFWITIP
jgi:AP-4 complex subunit epsilon-1